MKEPAEEPMTDQRCRFATRIVDRYGMSRREYPHTSKDRLLASDG